MDYLDQDLAVGADDTLDVTGLKCPEPLMMLRNRVRSLGDDARLYVVATDPTTRRDFQTFCRFMKHALEVDRDGAEGSLHFVIRKGGAR